MMGSLFEKSRDDETLCLIMACILSLVIGFSGMAMVASLQATQENKIVSAYFDKRKEIYQTLHREFNADLTQWGATLSSKTLTISFSSSNLMFNIGEADLRPKFESIMKGFIHRYIKIAKRFDADIKEIVIEGHTSSGWNHDSTEKEAFYNNLVLSQNRVRKVLQFITHKTALSASEVNWLQKKMVAVGYSSSRPILKANGQEHKSASRRISFTLITHDEKPLTALKGSHA